MQAADTDIVTLPFTLAKSMTVRFSGDDIRYNVGRSDLSLRLDGTEIFRSLTYTPTTQWTPAHVEWAGTVAAGAHTATLHGFEASVWGCGPSYGALNAVVTP